MAASKPKLLIIGSLPPPYHGCNVFVENLLRSDLRRRFDLIHLDTSDRRSLDTISKWDFINITLAVGHLMKLAGICLSRRPDLAHFSLSQNRSGYLRDGLFIIFIKLFTLAKCRIAVHLHGSFFGEFYDSSPRLIRRFVDFTLPLVSCAVVLGERLKTIFNRWLPESRIEVVSNGSALMPHLDGKFERNGHHALRIIYAGNLYRFKGVLDIIDAAEIVLKKHPTVKFLFAGSWGYDEIYHENGESIRAACEKRLAQIGRRDRFEFTGELTGKALEDYLVDGDIFVFPSMVEGMPMVILEAMAAGNAIISTQDVGAIPEMIRHEESGLLVEKKNPHALAEAIIALIENPAERSRYGRAARRRFEDHYTTAKSFERLAQVFEKTLAMKER
jgi:glycosyltransferase involved in cell wall biosynthesis